MGSSLYLNQSDGILAYSVIAYFAFIVSVLSAVLYVHRRISVADRSEEAVGVIG